MIKDKNKKLEIGSLAEIIEDRFKTFKHRGLDSKSYTHLLFSKGAKYIERKVLEEALEVILESHDRKKDLLISEIVDLLYHVLVLAVVHGISLKDIEQHLFIKHSSSETTTAPDRVLQILKKYAETSRPFGLQEMLEKCRYDMKVPTDVLFFSHNFRQSNLSNVVKPQCFSPLSKALRNKLQGADFKVKMVVPPGTREVFVRRRDFDIVMPIIFLLNSLALPVLLGMLAAYLKDIIDRKQQEKDTIEVNIGILQSEKTKGSEKWYQIKGSPSQVLRIISQISRSNGE